MELKSGIFAVVIASMVIAAIGVIITESEAYYNYGATSDLGPYNKLADSQAFVENYTGKINPQSGEASSDTESITFRGAYAFITGIPQFFRIGYDMIYTAANYWNIPGYIVNTIIIMIITAILTTIVAIVFRLSRPTA